ncbi:hypothetical protein ACQKWADRAFT_61025 [Trichoderma austrokoningii]
MASSSNPFRKPATTQHAQGPRFPAIDSISAVQLFPPPKTSFRDENVPPAAAQSPSHKAKVVKKVRVLSPPPRSPDSPELTASYFNNNSAAQAYAQEQDPFSNAVVDENSWEDASATAATTPPPQPQPALPQGRQPLMETTTQMQRPVQAVANPFSKKKTTTTTTTTQDLKEDVREEGEALRAAQSARRSLNVDSFKRLLMTGDASPLSSASPADSSSSDHDHINRAQDAAAPAAARANKEKKAPPPPPSSRHGKVIKPGHGVTSSESVISSPVERLAEPVAHHKEPSRPVLSRESSASSASSIEEDLPVKFDSHPAALTSSPDQMDASSTTPPHNAKKAVPAPPPRRQPKTNTVDSQESEPPPRTSMDSILSRSGSVRQSVNAPAPPPPRRTISSSKHPSHPSTSQSSTHMHPPELDPPRTSLDSTRPMAPPPPPPARNPSTRRPQSLYGLESSQRRAMSDIKPPRDTVAPPPPPSRSQSSTGGRSGRTSLDSARKPRTSADDFSDLNEQYLGQSVDILADLESLQREVDALRGKMG